MGRVTFLNPKRNLYMTIKGLQKLTLLDYPGKLAAIVFVGGCNFRCPFCHNGTLVLGNEGDLDIEEIYSFLESRKNKLSGVVISGGEPTLYPDLPDFIRRIRSFGYKIKLDTNGTNPEMIRMLVGEGLVDYVAMDIKNSPESYEATAGANVDMEKIRQSVDFLLSDAVEYEFRTTLVRQLHTHEDMKKIGEWIKGAKRYFLQSYKHTDGVISKGLDAHTTKTVAEFLEVVLPYVPNAQIRG